MEKCPKCGNYNIKEIKAMGGVKRQLCMDCGFQIILDKNRT